MPSPPTITLTAPCHLTVLAAILRLWPDGRVPNRRTLTVTKRNEMIAAQLAKMPGPAPTTPDFAGPDDPRGAAKTGEGDPEAGRAQPPL